MRARSRSRSPAHGVVSEFPTLLFQGYLYGTLDSVSPEDTVIGTDDGLRALPCGWELAPDEEVIKYNVISGHTWGTMVLVVGSGKGYGTKSNSGNRGSEPDGLVRQAREKKEGLLRKSRGKYGIRNDVRASCRILIRQKMYSVEQKSLGSHLWRCREFTDCTIRCQTSAISCHRAVIAAASPVFRQMLASDMREGLENSISIVDSTPCAVEAMIGFAYMGKAGLASSTFSIDDWQMILSLADKYQIPELVCISAGELRAQVDASNVVKVTRALRSLSDRPEVTSEWTALDALVRDRADLRAVILHDL